MGQNSYITHLYKAQDMPETIIEAWNELRASNPRLYSPYFHPNYTLEVAALSEDVNICVLEKDAKIVAILPYQGKSFARPVGAPLTDYHGIICNPDNAPSLNDMLCNVPVGAFHYSALIESTNKDVPDAQKGVVMDFPQGSEAWRKARDSSFNKHQKSLRRRIRKATEEIGEPRLVKQSLDDTELNTLVEWKTAQYEASGYYNVLGAGWTLNLLKSLLAKGPNAPLRLDMHCLYFGDKLAAVDTGLTDGKTYHSWIVAYEPDLRTYSPGAQLLNQIIDHSDALNYERIDLGIGIDAFKKYYATEDVNTESGFAAISGHAAKLSKLYHAAEKYGEKSFFDVPGKLRRRYSQVAACDDTFRGRTKAMLSAVTSSRHKSHL